MQNRFIASAAFPIWCSGDDVDEYVDDDDCDDDYDACHQSVAVREIFHKQTFSKILQAHVKLSGGEYVNLQTEKLKKWLDWIIWDTG